MGDHVEARGRQGMAVVFEDYLVEKEGMSRQEAAVLAASVLALLAMATRAADQVQGDVEAVEAGRRTLLEAVSTGCLRTAAAFLPGLGPLAGPLGALAIPALQGAAERAIGRMEEAQEEMHTRAGENTDRADRLREKVLCDVWSAREVLAEAARVDAEVEELLRGSGLSEEDVVQVVMEREGGSA